MIIIIKLKSNEIINLISAIAGMFFLLLTWREFLLFEALSEAVLEIYSSDRTPIILSERFLCDCLRVNHNAYVNT
jgi:hypothetical protein